MSDVTQESPAAKAGLKRGDILLRLADIPVSSPTDYREVLAEYTTSDRLRLTFWREGKERGVFVQPSTFPLDLALEVVSRRLGLEVGELDKSTREQYGLKGGVYIKKVRKDSEAGRIGLESGDLILKVYDMPIESLDGFKKAISRYHHHPSIALFVRRGPMGIR